MQRTESKQINKRSTKKKICLTIGCLAILVVGGMGIYHYHFQPKVVGHVEQIQSVKQIPKHLFMRHKSKLPHFVPSTFSANFQGYYLRTIPIHQIGLGKYYQIDELIRITPNNLYQQFIFAPKVIDNKTPTYQPTNSIKKAQNFKKIKKAISKRIPLYARALARHYRNKTKLVNYNLDAMPGDATQHGNNINYLLQAQTSVSGYSTKSLYTILGSSPVIRPWNYQHIKIDSALNNLKINNYSFKKIDLKKTKQIMNQSNEAPYFLGIGAEKVNMKHIK